MSRGAEAHCVKFLSKANVFLSSCGIKKIIFKNKKTTKAIEKFQMYSTP